MPLTVALPIFRSSVFISTGLTLMGLPKMCIRDRYNPYLGAAISLVMMVIVVICMVVMNRFGEGGEQAVMM